mmetsp:Transcript_46892/g.109557  ORF Transcript_46892/g.109557 Transcript_46892/m.109557 type:complete len:471 (-) Transcript_46892:155-1567(-)
MAVCPLVVRCKPPRFVLLEMHQEIACRQLRTWPPAVPPLVPKGHHGSPRSVHEVQEVALLRAKLAESGLDLVVGAVLQPEAHDPELTSSVLRHPIEDDLILFLAERPNAQARVLVELPSRHHFHPNSIWYMLRHNFELVAVPAEDAHSHRQTSALQFRPDTPLLVIGAICVTSQGGSCVYLPDEVGDLKGGTTGTKSGIDNAPLAPLLVLAVDRIADLLRKLKELSHVLPAPEGRLDAVVQRLLVSAEATPGTASQGGLCCDLVPVVSFVLSRELQKLQVLLLLELSPLKVLVEPLAVPHVALTCSPSKAPCSVAILHFLPLELVLSFLPKLLRKRRCQLLLLLHEPFASLARRHRLHPFSVSLPKDFLYELLSDHIRQLLLLLLAPLGFVGIETKLCPEDIFPDGVQVLRWDPRPHGLVCQMARVLKERPWQLSNGTRTRLYLVLDFFAFVAFPSIALELQERLGYRSL